MKLGIRTWNFSWASPFGQNEPAYDHLLPGLGGDQAAVRGNGEHFHVAGVVERLCGEASLRINIPDTDLVSAAA